MIKLNSVVCKATVLYENIELNVLLYLNPVSTGKIRTTCFVCTKANKKYWIGGRVIESNDLTTINVEKEIDLVFQNKAKVHKIYGKLTKHS